MVEPGWYPDPGDDPGRYRYFDGQSWSEQTSDDPRSPEPRPDPPPLGPGSSASRRWRPALIGLGVVTAVLALLAGWILARPQTSSYASDPWSPPPSAGTETTPGGGSSPSARPGAARPCPRGQPGRRAAHPADGRVHGGSLSFAPARDFGPPVTELGFRFAWDVAQQSRLVHANQALNTPGWTAQLVVGRVRSADGFDISAPDTAQRIAECTARSSFYRPERPTVTILRGATGSVDGQAAYVLAAELTIAGHEGGYQGDALTVVVVADGRDWSFFLSAVPLGDPDLAARARNVLQTLRAS